MDLRLRGLSSVRFLALCFSLCFAMGFALFCPVGVWGANNSEGQKLDELAIRFAEALKIGDSVYIDSQIESGVRGSLKGADLVRLWKQVKLKYGPLEKRLIARRESLGPYQVVFLPYRFKSAFLDMKIVYSSNGKVTGFFVLPHKEGYRLPSYVKPDTYIESPVQIGSGKWKLWGRLSVPKGKGPFPVLVLVHGSGPEDMDESIGSNKPFLDLASGLASSGIAVLRYTKRTKQYSLSADEIASMTVKEEVIDDAREAVKLVRQNPIVDPNRVFVLGHSMGGMLLPRIKKAAPAIKGMICLAGNNINLGDKLISQYEYLSSLGVKEAKKKLPALKQELEKIKNIRQSDLEGSNKIAMGASYLYWYDLNHYDPLEAMAHVKVPVLFLQGGRDYQVTVEGDFARWQAALKSPLFEFKLYPNLNHLFIEGTGKSTPNEYLQKSGNVAPSVVADIADWIKRY